MDNFPIFGPPRSLRFAAGPAYLADGDDDGGDDSGETTGDGSGGSATDLPPHLSTDELVRKHGDAKQALGALSQKVETLETERKNQREELREVKDQVPDDGSVILGPDKVEQLREDGFLDTDDPTGDDVLSALQAERQQRQTLENRQTFEEVVQVTGANREALKDLDADTLNYTLKEEQNDEGETVRRAYVETDDGQVEFTQHIQNEYPTLADNLLNGDATSGGSSSQSYPSQPSGGGSSTGGGDESGPTTSVDEFIDQENKKRGRGDEGE